MAQIGKVLPNATVAPPAQALTRYSLLFLAVWTGLAAVSILHHEMWRDELQAWMIAKSSGSIADLMRNLRYEGQPGLWALCLFVLSRCTAWPVSMQMLNLAVAGAGVYLLIRYAPFGRWTNGVLAFGYFPAYEYGTISRSYGLGVLGILTFCVLFSRHRRRYVWLGGVLVGLALTSAYGVIAAVALAAGAVVDAWHRPGPHRHRSSWRVGGLAAVVLVAAVVAGAQMRLPSDAGFDFQPRFAIEANAALTTGGAFVNGLLPIPPPMSSFWNGHALDRYPIVKAGAGLVLLLACLVVLRHHRTGLVVFAVHACGLLLFTYLLYLGGVRHHGHFFLLFLAGCWLALSSDQTPGDRRLLRLFLASLAFVHLGAGVVAVAIDVRLPFSGSKAAAAYITTHYAPDTPIVVDSELPGVPIAALTRRAVYFAQSERWGTFVLWNRDRQRPGIARAVAAADRASRELERDLLLVLSYRDKPPARFEHVGYFPGMIVRNESYDLYLLRRGR